MQVLTLVLSSAFYLLPGNIQSTEECGDVNLNTPNLYTLAPTQNTFQVQQISPSLGLKRLSHQPKLNAMKP